MVPQAPEESEWNFILVPPDELPWCVLWEYARSSPEHWVETAVEAWFSRKLKNGNSVLEILTHLPPLPDSKFPAHCPA